MSNKKILSTDKAPAAIGPYSQGNATDTLVFLSGQLPINPASGKIEADTIEAQTEQSLKNAQAILASEGLTMAHVVKTTVFLASMGDFAAMNGVYAKFFSENCPARSCFQVAALPLGAMVEIEMIASKA